RSPEVALAAQTLATPLDRYLADLRTLRVEFTQQLVDARGRESQRGSGTLIVQRPGRFRWDIHAGSDDAGQLLVADGRNLWFFDRDLEQVSVKPASVALTATPAILLSGDADIRQSFEVRSLPREGGLDWVQVRPKSVDADFREARLGFAKRDLKRMVLADKLGQTATLVFGRALRNGPVAPSEVEFAPPPGVDVIGTPLR
ncbi:MAG: outer membrane lipoprotein chaperone LolA, partial [Steroidobacteraceae bacterium]